MDPLGGLLNGVGMQAQKQSQPKKQNSASLFDEDDILGVISSSDPMSTAAH